MNKKQLRDKLITLNIYADSMAKAVVNRYKFPSYKKLLEIEKKLKLSTVDFNNLILSFGVKNNTKNNSKKSNLKINKEVS